MAILPMKIGIVILLNLVVEIAFL